ncbi:THAP domain-containing protein 11 [Stylophora pistillata]|uniref:THAP domain-containing protein 11 n=1 Tax=Stylophora pistillata TaxID=50429 RepID=A0A2B4R612_STYPI|nr:THAP domain-containing protein 11 [Stylophora pistillata]
MTVYRCCVGGCDNDSRYKEKIVKRSHVEGELRWHHIPKQPEKRKQWTKNVSKGLSGFVASDHKTVCSNHFEYGKPTFASPNPTLFSVPSDKNKSSPRKRKLPTRTSEGPSTKETKELKYKETGSQCTIINPLAYSSLTFAHLTREHDVNNFTGLTVKSFRLIFDHVKGKALVMHYWKGPKRTGDLSKLKIDRQMRALTLEQEFLLTMMKLRLGLFLFDLTFRFDISASATSSIFTTWVKFLAKELKWRLVWPDRVDTHRNLPDMFRKYYPKCRVLLDCPEIYIETPSDLAVAAQCWSDYKHHRTIKFLVGITPNGAISLPSDGYGGRASDLFIVEDCGFVNYLKPHDQVMGLMSGKPHL